eukprot:4075359-Ditylum_brightwellii.AAC.1
MTPGKCLMPNFVLNIIIKWKNCKSIERARSSHSQHHQQLQPQYLLTSCHSASNCHSFEMP